MKKTAALIACLCFLAVGTATSQTALEDWENPALLHAGTERPRATFVPFPDAASALRLGPKDSPRYLSLNGPWKFHWSPRPADRPLDFWNPSTDVSGWKETPVPSNWMFQGYDHPIYVNIPYEFARNPKPPFVPHDRNPVGSYRRTFTVPDGVEGHARLPPLRRGQIVLLRLGQRREDRFQQGLEDPGRIRHHAVPRARRERPGGRGLPLVGRLLSRVPGLLAAGRHRARRLSLCRPEGPHPRLRGPGRTGRSVQERPSRARRRDRRGRSRDGGPPVRRDDPPRPRRKEGPLRRAAGRDRGGRSRRRPLRRDGPGRPALERRDARSLPARARAQGRGGEDARSRHRRRSASGRARSRTASSSSTASRSGSRASTATSTIRTRAMSSPRSPCGATSSS